MAPGERPRRRPPGSRRSDGRNRWAPGISSDCKSLLVSFQFYTMPLLQQLMTHAQVSDAEQGEVFVSLPATYLEPIFFGSQPPVQDGCASILLLGWVLVFSANFPKPLAVRVDSTRSDSKNSPIFPKWDWFDGFSSADPNQVRCPPRHPLCGSQEMCLLLVLTLCGYTATGRQTQPCGTATRAAGRSSNLLGSFPWHSWPESLPSVSSMTRWAHFPPCSELF